MDEICFIEFINEHNILAEKIEQEVTSNIYKTIAHKFVGGDRCEKAFFLWDIVSNNASIRINNLKLNILNDFVGNEFIVFSINKLFGYKISNTTKESFFEKNILDEFYITNSEFEYLICYNHEEYLIGWGTAIKFILDYNMNNIENCPNLFNRELEIILEELNNDIVNIENIDNILINIEDLFQLRPARVFAIMRLLYILNDDFDDQLNYRILNLVKNISYDVDFYYGVIDVAFRLKKNAPKLFIEILNNFLNNEDDYEEFMKTLESTHLDPNSVQIVKHII